MEFYAYLSLIAVATFISGFLPIVIPRVKDFTQVLVPLSAGLLVGTALFHLLPEAIEIVGGGVGIAMLLGFALFYLPQKFVMAHPCHEETCNFHQLGMFAFVGLSLHALMDGIGLGATANMQELNVVAIAIIAHKLPASLALSFMLSASSANRSRNILLMALFAIATPVGAILTSTVIGGISSVWLGSALAFSAGNFLAIAGSDLLRRLHERNEKNKIWRIAATAIGTTIPLLFA